ncbi:GYF domain-containing protein [Acetobacteraceae bacterium KSS8]|uniref:GYF domain-containing protein n=1 Tax=Endosaccharibacter trunci TaxID=2812733 RepID=A0ABT1W964_9PROT|nr:GYF domain-containing protein [Acetobacteraceae bacterium KSS8]
MSATTSGQPDAATPRRVQPTLFVGLGGTGMQILLRLRRRILTADWNGRRIDDLSRFPIASFVYFDTDLRTAIESDRQANTDPLARIVAFRENERLQHAVDVKRYMKDIDRYPLIADWLPIADFALINTEKGAGQVRAISRLLFFDQFRKLSDMLRERADHLLRSVGHQDDLAHLGLEVENRLRVVVVCSAAGGTGSGAFIDLGLALRSLIHPMPTVELVLLLPGGYQDHQRQRVSANGYAALMELEHAMRPNPSPPFVEQWAEHQGPAANIAPFDDVYLLDTRNVLDDGLDGVEDLYDMAADILFEDFGTSEFAATKRSIAVNQAQHKVDNYEPPLPAKLGRQALRYSQLFSSFGQSTIDTKSRVAVDSAVAETSKAMLKAYFNVALEDSGRLPTPSERDDFLDQQFFLQPNPFQHVLPGASDTGTINEPALIERLLEDGNGQPILAGIDRDLLATYQSEAFNGADPRNLPTLALREFEQRHGDVLGTIRHKSGSGLAADLILATRNRLTAERASAGPHGLRAVLFDYLDQRDRGGLDYTIRLVEDSKLQLETEIGRLFEIETRYAARAAETQRRFEQSLDNLREAVNRRLFGPDRKAAERYLEHLRTETSYYLAMQLRRQAAVEAQQFLRDMSEMLGTRRGQDADGNTLWDGAVSELVQGRLLVRRTLAEFDTEIGLLREAVSRRDAGTFVVLPEADAEAHAMLDSDPAEIARWAQEMFRDEGGSRVLFPILRDDSARAVLLNRLRGFARAQLAPRAESLRSAQSILLDMSARDRMAIFQRAMIRAMPWLDASFDHLGSGIAMGPRYTLLIATDDKDSFERNFGAEIAQVVPTGRLGIGAPQYLNSGLRDRILIYCELSGIPLDSIDPLRTDWRIAYQLEQKRPMPLHTHRQSERFPDPVVPTTREIEEMRRNMELFVRGVAYGILQRGARPGEPYQIDLGGGDWGDAGTERVIRSSGFSRHRDKVQSRVEAFEQGLSKLQLLAAAALIGWTGERVYAARKSRIGPTQTDRIPGLVQILASEIAADLRERAATIPTAPADIASAYAALSRSIPDWTVALPGSATDADPHDANQDPSDPPETRAQDKRRIVPERFTDAALARLLQPDAATTTLPRDEATPTAAWHLSIAKQLSGPFSLAEMRVLAGNGTLREGTNVRLLGSAQWQRVRDVPVLLDLLRDTLPEDEESLPDDE